MKRSIVSLSMSSARRKELQETRNRNILQKCAQRRVRRVVYFSFESMSLEHGVVKGGIFSERVASYQSFLQRLVHDMMTSTFSIVLVLQESRQLFCET